MKGRPLWAQAPFPSRGDGAVRPAGCTRAQRGDAGRRLGARLTSAPESCPGRRGGRSCPFGAPKTRQGSAGAGGEGQRTKMRGDGRLLALPRTELRSLPHVCTKENDGTERTRVFSTRVRTAADSGLRAGGGRRPCVSPPRLGWDLGGRPQARGPLPDPCSSRAWTPAGRVKQVQDTQCGGKTRPDGDTGTLCVHRPP